ncbi:predicted protein [Paecilomyces variotii No. 5]|uniref:Cytochrome P450 n=1 Tax=Byssochlamys spectabilis (strain No. 5 / NBRC 109023) TaxID=1356009 RepID=V5G830_BYSSN|nr:predicted protein [Paecilomyces variotii No. 5]
MAANYLAFDVIGSFAFGRPFGFITSGYDRYDLIQTIDTRGEYVNALGTVPPILRGCIRFAVFDDFWAKGLKARSNLGKMGTDAFLQRKATMGGEQTRRDLMSFLFNATDPQTAKPLPDEEIVAESISFIVGGSDTTSSTMTNFIDIVSRRPLIQQQLQAELDEAFPHVRSDWVTPHKSVQNLPFLDAVLKEVMRYRPISATGLERLTPNGGRVVAGHFLPGGTLVSVPTSDILNDESIFPNPAEFNPQRWLQSDTSMMLQYFQPFSYGPRSCIGRNFAWMEILKAMATLFRLFHVERAKSEETTYREGFFNKATECAVVLKRR